MNPLIQLKKAIQLFVIALGLVCFGLSPKVQAANETRSNANTGEGDGALQSVTTGSNNTALGAGALFSLTDGVQNTATGAQALKINTGHSNTADGFQALVNNGAAIDNTATGWRALFQNSTGNENTATGSQALYSNTEGTGNMADGFFALFLNTTGIFNTAVGAAALDDNTTGNSNIALGREAGFNLTTGDFNIDIGNGGVAGESATIRIGDFNQTATFIAGIYGATTGSSTTLPVIVDVNGQLGTTASSERFKTGIKPMDKTSEAILSFKPVTFHYKNDTKGIPQFGLVAEDVAKVNPDLVVRNADGEIYTVRYDAVNAMLLNEFLKAHRTVQEQQKEIDALKAELKEQRALIQKVSDKMELNKPAPQTVVSN